MADVERSLFATLALSGLVMLVGQVSYGYYAAEEEARVGLPISAAEYREKRVAFEAEFGEEQEFERNGPAIRLARFDIGSTDNLLTACESNSPSRSLGRCGRSLAIK